MTEPGTVLAWARSVDATRPVRWGDVEAMVLAEPAPSDAELAAMPRPPRVAGVVVVLLAAVFYASPLIGLGMILAGLSAIPSEAAVWFRFAPLAFVVALVAAVLPVLTSADHKHRGRFALAGTGGILAVAITSLLVLQGAAVPTGWTTWVVGAVLAASAISLVILLVARRPASGGPRVRESSMSQRDLWYLGTRAHVLEILMERGVVRRADTDAPAMIQMPLGTWGQLDGTSGPDRR